MDPIVEIIPLSLSKDIFNDYEYVMRDLQNNNDCFITNLNVISKLLIRDEYPIKNKRIAIKNILGFLNYLDGLHRKENTSLINISQKVLVDFLGRDQYGKYMTILKDLEIITCVPYQDGTLYKIPNKKEKICGLSKRYRLFNNYINNEDLCIVLIEDNNKKLELELECEIDIDSRFRNTILKLNLNFKDVIISEIINAKNNNLTHNELRKRLASSFSTKHRRYIKQGTKVDRIYHSFSNITRIARKYLNINFMTIDVVNCQPALLICYLNKNKYKIDENYIKVCESGEFYESFMNDEDINDPEKRDKTKVKLYNSVFFGFFPDSKTNQKFKELYPLIWETLSELKKDNISLIAELNNIEADLFNNLKPKKSKFYFTLFDAIYFSSFEDYSELDSNIRDYFKKLNINIKTK